MQSVALPVELNTDQQRDLVRNFAREFTDRGMIADASIHEPDRSVENPHFHLGVAMREIDGE